MGSCFTKPQPSENTGSASESDTDGASSLGGLVPSALGGQNDIAHPVYDPITRSWTYGCIHPLNATNDACWNEWDGNDATMSSAVQVGGDGVGTGDAFSAVGALGDFGGDDASSAVDAPWDGLVLECQLEVGKVPIPYKTAIRKVLADRYGQHKNQVLRTIDSGKFKDASKMILLGAWKDTKTPPVLMCLIADIFHKHECEKELGELPTYYILPYTQKKGKRKNKNKNKEWDTVDCHICQNRRGGCKCCTACYNRNGECTCGK